MTPKQKVLEMAKELNVKVIERCGEVCLEAPHGKKFNGLDVHVLVYDYSLDDRGKRAAWTAIFADLVWGLEDCTDPDCEFCNDF